MSITPTTILKSFRSLKTDVNFLFTLNLKLEFENNNFYNHLKAAGKLLDKMSSLGRKFFGDSFSKRMPITPKNRSVLCKAKISYEISSLLDFKAWFFGSFLLICI